ncbi:septin-7 isoform X7, partial [Vespula maculifrons]
CEINDSIVAISIIRFLVASCRVSFYIENKDAARSCRIVKMSSTTASRRRLNPAVLARYDRQQKSPSQQHVIHRFTGNVVTLCRYMYSDNYALDIDNMLI